MFSALLFPGKPVQTENKRWLRVTDIVVSSFSLYGFLVPLLLPLLPLSVCVLSPVPGHANGAFCPSSRSSQQTGGPWPWPTVLCVWQFIVWCHKCPNKCDIYLQRSIGILICLPGPGTDCLSTLTSSLFLPRLMCEHLEWWQFRFNLEMFLPRHRVSLTLMVRRQKWGWRCPVIPLIRTFQECYY